MLTWIRNALKPPNFENDEDSLAASLLHTILLIFAAAGFFVPLLLNFVALLSQNDEIRFEFTTLIMGLIVPVLALGLLRLLHQGRVRLASTIMTGTLFLLTTTTIITFRGTRDTAASMYILVIALAGLLLGGRAAIIFVVLSILTTFGIYLAEVIGFLNVDVPETPGIIEWMIFAIVLFLIGILLRFAFETLTTAFRQARVANKELEGIQSSLSDRVSARTRDLELAVEIGRNLSSMQKSEGILLEAVELIRSRFDLYYTQIYLVDTVRNNLVIRAGTGAVGRQLRQLGHRLPISGSSINGTAVINKKPVVVSDTEASIIFRKNPLLPETRSEMAIPLLVSENVIGILNVQSSIPNSLTDENLPAFEALAGQLSVALDNARLFSEAAEAQAVVESLVQRFTRSGWDSYFNAINRQERSYTYDLTNTEFVEDLAESNGRPSFSIPISLGGEILGQIEIRGNEWDTWQEEDKALVAAVGERVAQQIENLRLLSETERYRSEAEDATRHLVREGWETYLEGQTEQSDGYLYDRNQIMPFPTNGSNGKKETALVQPLTVRGEEIGQLEIDGVSNEDGEVSNLVGAVAEQLSAHIENLRLTNQTEVALKSTEKRAEELAVINELARTVSQQLDLEHMLEAVYEQVRRVVSADAFIVGLYDRETNLIYYPLIYDEGERFQEDAIYLPKDTSMYSVLMSGKSLMVVYDSEEEVPAGEILEKNALGNNTKASRSMMFVPLIFSNEVVGVISVQSYQFHAYTNEDITLIEGIASHLSVAIQNVQLFEQTQSALAETEEQAARLALLTELGQALTQASTLEDVYKVTADMAHHIVDSDRTSVALLDGKGEHYEIFALGGEKSASTVGDRQPLEGSAVDQAIQNNEIVVVNNSDNTGIPGVFSYMIAPLVTSNKIIGTLNIGSKSRRIFGTREEGLLRQMASLLATTIESRRLFGETQQRAQELSVVNQIAQAVSGKIEQAELLKTVYEQIQRVMTVDAFSVTAYNPTTEMIHYLLMIDEGKQFDEKPSPLGFGAVSKVITEGRPILIVRTQEELDELAQKGSLLRIGNVQRYSACLIFAPLQIGSETIGGLSVQTYELNAYSQSEVDLLVGIANHVAVALENARLFEATQTTLAETELLYNIGTQINQAATLADLANVVGIPGIASGASSAGLFRFELDEDGEPEWMELKASWSGTGSPVMPIGTRAKLSTLPYGAAEFYTPTNMVLISNIEQDELLDEEGRRLLENLNTKAVAIIPMHQLDTWIGTLIVRWDEPHTFEAQDQRLYDSLARQMSTALSNQLLLTETQDRAGQLEKIAQIETALSQAQDEDGILESLSLFFDKDQVASIYYVVEVDKPKNAFAVAHWEGGQIQNVADLMLFDSFDIQQHTGLELGLKQPDRISFVSDVQSDGRISKAAVKEAKEMGYRSIMVVPLRSAGRWQGFVLVKWPEVYEFSAAETAVWEQLRESLAAIVASRRAYLAQQDALSETAVLYETGAQLSVAHNFDEVLTVIRKNTFLGQNVSNVSIMLFEHGWQQDRIPNYADVLAFWSEIPPEQAKMRFQLSSYPSAKKLLDNHSRPLIIKDISKSKEIDKHLKRTLINGFNTNTFVVFPMVIRGDWIGYVNAMYPEPTTISEKEIRQTEAIIQQAGIAVQGLRNLEQAEQQALEARNRSNELVILNEMGRSLTALVDMDSILENVYRYTARLMDASNFYVSFFDGKRDEITFALDIRGDRVMKNVGTRKVGKGLTEHIIYSKEPLLIPENVDEKLDELGIEQIGPPAASWLGVPLLVGSQVIGVIGLQTWDVPRTYNEQHLRLLTSVAAQAAIAIENARLFEQIQARARRERILREVTAKVRSGADADTVMRTAVSEIGRALGRRTFVYLNKTDAQGTELGKEEAYGD